MAKKYQKKFSHEHSVSALYRCGKEIEGPLPWKVSSVRGDITPERAQDVIKYWLDRHINPISIIRFLNVGKTAFEEFMYRPNAIPKEVGERIARLWKDYENHSFEGLKKK